MDKLTSLGYISSLINDCVFFRGDIIFMVYLDDGIFLGNEDAQLKQAIQEIQNVGLNIEDKATLQIMLESVSRSFAKDPTRSSPSMH